MKKLGKKIGPEHIMASGALPPGFPTVEIDGEHFWDGGIASNTPLDYVLDEETDRDLLIFQVDLFSARGELPTTLLRSRRARKDIRFSSRTRMNTDKNKLIHNARMAIARPDWEAAGLSQERSVGRTVAPGFQGKHRHGGAP
jgi:NTE family protein